MPVYGNLGTMALTDLLGWIATVRKAGCLRVEHGGRSTRIWIEDGVVRRCLSDDPPTLLGQFLLFRGLITEDVLRRAMAEQESTGQGLPEILEALGAVSREAVDKEVQRKAEETIFGLFDAEDGAFEFDDRAGEPDAKSIVVNRGVEEMLLSGVKRIDDRARMRAELGVDAVPAHTGKLPPASLNEDWPARNVYDAIDGRRTVGEIVLRVHGTEYLVAGILLDLLRRDLIRIAGERRASEPERRPAAEPRDETDHEAALRLLSLGQPGEALDRLTTAYHTDPSDSAVRRLRTEAEEAVIEELVSDGLTPSKVPVPIRARQDRPGEEISAAEEFLLDVCDGSWDIKSLTWVAPMRPVELMTGLKHLLDLGYIELRDAA